MWGKQLKIENLTYLENLTNKRGANRDSGVVGQLLMLITSKNDFNLQGVDRKHKKVQ